MYEPRSRRLVNAIATGAWLIDDEVVRVEMWSAETGHIHQGANTDGAEYCAINIPCTIIPIDGCWHVPEEELTSVLEAVERRRYN